MRPRHTRAIAPYAAPYAAPPYCASCRRPPASAPAIPFLGGCGPLGEIEAVVKLLKTLKGATGLFDSGPPPGGAVGGESVKEIDAAIDALRKELMRDLNRLGTDNVQNIKDIQALQKAMDALKASSSFEEFQEKLKKIKN